ncbi:MAG: glycine zipper 2TM domain-containing protein [Caulobacter sp.]
MKTKVITLAMASAIALSAGGAFAQSQVPTWDEYNSQQRAYQQQQGAYERQQDAYQDRQAAYADQRRAYEAKRAQYLRDRAAYDRRYGSGAYERQYGAWRFEPAPYDAGGYGRDASTTGYDHYRNSPCEQRRGNNTTAGLIIGALAGAAIGSNVAAGDVQTEGAVLGALVGGGLGAKIGRDSARCDSRGYWYSRNETVPYREGGYYRNRGERSGQYGYNQYARRGCRLAAAPTDYSGRTDYRYVRVCPDRQGRYRITG